MSLRKTASAMGDRQMLPVQTKQMRKSADSSSGRSKLMTPLSRLDRSSTATLGFRRHRRWSRAPGAGGAVATMDQFRSAGGAREPRPATRRRAEAPTRPLGGAGGDPLDP